MALSRAHAKVSAIPDGADANVVRPSDWNAAHALSGAVSGGIPYFDSTTTEATSALLAANGIVLGGGAGAAPFTASGLSYASSQLIGPIGGVGAPTYTATGNLTSGFYFGATGWNTFASGGIGTVAFGPARMQVRGDGTIEWSAGTGNIFGSSTTSLSQVSNGLLGVGTGAQGSVAGSLSLTNLTTIATSSTGTSAIIDGSNILRPLTSSERFKTNIQTWEPTDKEIQAFLALPAISFDYQDNAARIEPAQFIPAKVEKQPSPILDAQGNAPLIDVIVEPAKTIPAWEIEPAREGVKNVLGFSAEKIDAAGLAQLINYDAQGLPYSLREHGIIAMLFAVIKRQEARISALEAA